jgi:predicted DNA-binding antitoxin AbrB/MazE fold protein
VRQPVSSGRAALLAKGSRDTDFPRFSENGVLKPVQPLPLKEQERVQVTVHTASNWVQETAGMIEWTGDHETLRRLAEDVEHDPRENA